MSLRLNGEWTSLSVDPSSKIAILSLDEEAMMPLTVGQRVTIYHGTSGTAAGTGKVLKISPAGKRITVRLNSGITNFFYRNRESTRYVKDPRAGQFGSMLNDYIPIPEDDDATEAA